MKDIDPDTIQSVEFYKRDELTTDLVCCEITANTNDAAQVFVFHEEAPEWHSVLRLVERLPGFDRSWPEKVMKPAFAENRTVAFQRLE